MSRPRRATLVLGCGAALVACVWLVARPTPPPLYDSLPVPSDPYRYLHPPPGLTTPPASSVDETVAVTGGVSPVIVKATNENPSQAQLLAEQGAFALPPGTDAVRVRIAPVDPPATPPPDGRVDGNVYLFEVSAGGSPLRLDPGKPATVVLRGPAGAGTATIEVYDGHRWTRVATSPVGTADMYQGNVTTLGDAALVVPNGTGGGGNPAGGGSGGLGSGVIAAIVAGAVVVLAAGALLVVRARQTAPPPPPPRGRGRPPKRGRR